MYTNDIAFVIELVVEYYIFSPRLHPESVTSNVCQSTGGALAIYVHEVHGDYGNR